MARSRQTTETRRTREADEADDDRDAYEDEGDAPYEDDEPDSQYENEYEDEGDAPYEDDGPDSQYEHEYEDDDDEGDETDDRGSSPDTDRSLRRSKRRMSAAGAAQAALRNVAELTTKEPTGITSLDSSEDGWVVGVEVVEDKRVPSSADILAVYEAEIDDEDGSLVSYRRERRYTRGQGDR